MSRALWTLVAAIAYAAASDAASHHDDVDVKSLQPGVYYRPSDLVGSGFTGTNATFRRSPCPAVNTLVNHGFLPRDGQNITKKMLKFAVMFFYNIDEPTAESQVAHLPNGFFSLDVMAEGPPAHDGSLVRVDDNYRIDPIFVDKKLLHDFLGRADSNGKIDTAVMARVRRDRALTCKKKNPECKFGPTEKAIAFRQAALILIVFGEGDFIFAADAKSFLGMERFPKNYGKPCHSVTTDALRAKEDEMIALAGPF